MIYTLAFSPQEPIVEAIPADQACQSVNEAMEVWGCPRRIKIDNGLPFAAAGNKDIPTRSQLWWIGLGIEVHLNAVRVPEENGTVEGLQGICCRWSAPSIYDNPQDYQQRLKETNRIQREVYRIRKKGDKTRCELYPELWQNPRRYDPNDFKMERIYENLATRVWKRRVAVGGCVNFWKVSIYIGTDFVDHPTTITFDPVELQWMVRAKDGRLLKTKSLTLPESSEGFFTETQILKHAGISKN